MKIKALTECHFAVNSAAQIKIRDIEWNHFAIRRERERAFCCSLG